jgi:hypothetical protein
MSGCFSALSEFFLEQSIRILVQGTGLSQGHALLNNQNISENLTK